MLNRHRKSHRPSSDRPLPGRKRFVQLPTEVIANPNRPQWLSLSPRQIELVFLDFETTGGNPTNSAIIEIGAVKFKDGVEVGRFETLVNPERPIPGIVQKITGINNEMVKTAPLMPALFDDFMDFIGDAVVVAHGALGDVPFVSHWTHQLRGQEFKNYYFCTHLIVSHLLPHIPSKSLTGVMSYFGLDAKDAHSAMSDAQMTAQIFWKILAVCEKNGYRTCDDLLKIQADNETIRKLGPGINPAIVENTPTTPGVVYLLNSHHEISHITACENIRKSLSMFTSIGQDRDWNKIIVDACRFKFERTGHFLDALLREKRELKRVHVPRDPRTSSERAQRFLQLFIPDDILEYAENHPEEASFLEGLRDLKDTLEDSISLEDRLLQTQKADVSQEQSMYLRTDEEPSAVAVVKTRKILQRQEHDKYRVVRKRRHPHFLHEGYLKEGVGYFWGPFDAQRSAEVRKGMEELLQKFPLEDASYPIRERLQHLRIVVAACFGLLSEELDLLEQECKKIHSLRRVTHWLRTIYIMRSAQKWLEESIFNPIVQPEECPRSGLAMISNNELKELEIFAVARGRIVRKLRLPFSQIERLKSPRYFTRIFEPYYAAIQNPMTPLIFTDDTCSETELFSFWLKQKRGEGEWSSFDDLAGLFDPSLII